MKLTRATIEKYRQDPVAFIGDLRCPTRFGVKPMRELMAPFHRDLLVLLAPSLLAVARGEMPALRFFFLLWSKGANKTTLIAACCLWLALFGQITIDMVCGAGDQAQAAEIRAVIKELIKLNDLDNEIAVNNYEVKSLLPAESMLRILASDAKTSHGSRPRLTIIEEMVHITDEAFVDALLSNASKLGGLVIVCSNAGILDSWQHKRYLQWAADPAWTISIYDKPAPWITEEDIAKLGMPQARVRRLYYSEWVSELSSVITEADLKAAVNQSGPLEQADPDYILAGGIDLAQVRDHAAAVLIGRHRITRRLRLAQVRSWAPRGGKIDMQEVATVIAEMHQVYRPICWYLDPGGGGYIFSQDLQRRGLWPELVPMTGATSGEAATLLIEVFADRLFDLYAHEQLLHDFRRLQLKESPSGLKLVATHSAVTGHADRGFAAVLALLALKRNQFAGWGGSPDPNLMATMQADFERGRDRRREDRTQCRGRLGGSAGLMSRWNRRHSNDDDDPASYSTPHR